jgi:hypothetical protein
VRLNNHVGTTKNNGATTLSECQNLCTNDTDSTQNSAQYQVKRIVWYDMHNIIIQYE